jgi:hypothetical protein
MFTLVRIDHNQYIVLTFSAVAEGNHLFVRDYLRSICVSDDIIEQAMNSVDEVVDGCAAKSVTQLLKSG